mgnify:CR=1 FL=1
MTFLATGDQHLGKGLDLGRVPGERLAEQEAVWAAALALARDLRCDAVLHAGDLFDGRRPGPDVMLAAERPLVEHQVEGGCTVYVIAGNHDVPSQDGPCGLDVLAEAGLIELAREPKVWRIPSGMDTDVEVCALPWAPLSRLVAADEGETPREELATLAADLLLETARGMWKPTLPIEPGQILLGHWAVSDTSLPNGLDVGSLGGVVLPMDDLEGLWSGQMIFGHIHKGACYGDFTYVGSPMPLDFGEASDDHGCWIMEWDEALRLWALEFVPLPSRPFVTQDLDSESVIDDTWIARAGLAGAYVKLRYSATEDQARRIDQAAVRASLEEAGAYRVFIEPTISRAHRERGAAIDSEGTRIDQLAAYLEASGTNSSVGAAMIERAAGYLT